MTGRPMVNGRMVTRREADIAMLSRILATANQPELSEDETRRARDMLSVLGCHDQHELTTKQRSWASAIDDRLRPIAASTVPRGRPVEPPAVLRAPLPLKPPGRR